MPGMSVVIKAVYRTFWKFSPRTHSVFNLSIISGSKEKPSSFVLRPNTKFPLTCPGYVNSVFDLDHSSVQGDIKRIKISRHFGHGIGECFLESVLITGPGNRNFMFPYQRWLVSGQEYTIQLNDCYLPEEGDAQRRKELEEMRHLYQYAVASQDALVEEDGDMPAQVLQVPYQDEFGYLYEIDIFMKKAGLSLREDAYVLFKGRNWRNMDDLTSVYSPLTGIPYGVDRWKKDFFFGWQRMNGLNPILIRQCTNIGQVTQKIQVVEKEVLRYLKNQTIEGALNEQRLFIVDLALLTDVPTKEGFHCPAPVALFHRDDHGYLLPIAIQLHPPNRQDRFKFVGPVFYPHDDPNTWLLAKMWYNLADASYHQSVTHLGFTHLIMEGIAVCAHRQLSKSHPLFKLLAPHFFYLMAINDLARNRLINKGGWVDRVMNIGVQGMMTLISRRLNGYGDQPAWRLNADANPIKDADERGMNDEDLLPSYYYRKDTCELYDAIKDYVTQYVHLYYNNDEAIIRDNELQGFGAELTRKRPSSQDQSLDVQVGCGLQGVFYGQNNQFLTKDEVVNILSNIIFTCSVQHAAVNFPQYDEYGFPGNYPLTLYGKPPTVKRPVIDKKILQTLPNRKTTMEIMTITEILSEKATMSLGDFEVNWIYDPNAKGILASFQRNLQTIGMRIKERNVNTVPAYNWLDPENIPNAISI